MLRSKIENCRWTKVVEIKIKLLVSAFVLLAYCPHAVNAVTELQFGWILGDELYGDVLVSLKLVDSRNLFSKNSNHKINSNINELLLLDALD